MGGPPFVIFEEVGTPEADTVKIFPYPTQFASVIKVPASVRG